MNHRPLTIGLVALAGMLCLSTLAAVATAQPAADAPSTRPLVYVIPVEGEFENALHLILVRALREARAEGADAIVLDMDTPGGRVDSAIKIRDELIRTPVRTLTFVNPMAISAGSFIALATDTIVMGPNSSIGGALPIQLTGGAPSAADEKFISIFNAEMRKTAKTKGHDPELAQAFSDPDMEIPGLKEKGQVLTLDYDQATSLGLAAYRAGSIDELLAREGLGAARIRTFELGATDKLARFLSSQPIMGLLMMIGLAGLFIELKTPGVGLPGAIGLLALGLAFFGSYLANLSSYIEWILFALGVVLLLMEIFVIPGFGVAGIAGLSLIVGALLFAMVNLSPDSPWRGLMDPARLATMTMPLVTILGVLIGLIPFLYFLVRLLPATPLYGRLVLHPEPSLPGEGSADPRSAEGTSGLTAGMRGVAATDCHPSGMGEFAGRRIDVQTEGEFIARGTPIVLCRREAGRWFVAQSAG